MVIMEKLCIHITGPANCCSIVSQYDHLLIIIIISAIVSYLIKRLICKIKSISIQRGLPQTKEIHNYGNLNFSRLRNNMESIR